MIPYLDLQKINDRHKADFESAFKGRSLLNFAVGQRRPGYGRRPGSVQFLRAAGQPAGL